MRPDLGFLTSMHDGVPWDGKSHTVPIFNPASNSNRVSGLRLFNHGSMEAER